MCLFISVTPVYLICIVSSPYIIGGLLVLQGGTISSYTVHVKANSTGEWKDASNSVGGTANVAVISDIDPHDTYYFRVVAANEHGDSLPSPVTIGLIAEPIRPSFATELSPQVPERGLHLRYSRLSVISWPALAL